MSAFEIGGWAEGVFVQPLCLLAAGGSASCDPETFTAADVSGDGVVTSLGALMILQVAAGAIAMC